MSIMNLFYLVLLCLVLSCSKPQTTTPPPPTNNLVPPHNKPADNSQEVWFDRFFEALEKQFSEIIQDCKRRRTCFYEEAENHLIEEACLTKGYFTDRQDCYEHSYDFMRSYYSKNNYRVGSSTNSRSRSGSSSSSASRSSPSPALVQQIAPPSSESNSEAESETPTPPEPSISGFCERTEEVRTAILAKLPSVDNCNAVTQSHLDTITELTVVAKSKGDGSCPSSRATFKAGDLSGLRNLKNFILDSCIETIPSTIFSGSSSTNPLLPKLEKIDLSTSYVLNLDTKIFDNLPKLKEIKFPECHTQTNFNDADLPSIRTLFGLGGSVNIIAGC